MTPVPSGAGAVGRSAVGADGARPGTARSAGPGADGAPPAVPGPRPAAPDGADPATTMFGPVAPQGAPPAPRAAPVPPPAIPVPRPPADRPPPADPSAEATVRTGPVPGGGTPTEHIAVVPPQRTAAPPDGAAPRVPPPPTTRRPAGDRRRGSRTERSRGTESPGSGRSEPRAGRRARPAAVGWRATELAVAGGGAVALVAFLFVPHLTAPDTGALTVPALIRLATGAEPAVRLLWLVGAAAALTAVLGGIAAGVRHRGARSTLLAAVLPATAVPSLGYLTVGVAALGQGSPALAPGFALAGVGLLVAFVAAIAGLMTP